MKRLRAVLFAIEVGAFGVLTLWSLSRGVLSLFY